MASLCTDHKQCLGEVTLSGRAPQYHLTSPIAYEHVVHWRRFWNKDIIRSDEQMSIQATIKIFIYVA